MSIKQEALAFDEDVFEAANAGKLAGDVEATGWLDQFRSTKASIGAGFENHRACQFFAAQLNNRKIKWDRADAHQTWANANPGKHADWLVANAALNAADGGTRRTS